MKTTVAVLEKSGGDAATKVVSLLVKSFPESNTRFVLATPDKIAIAEGSKPLYTKKVTSVTAVGNASTSGRGETVTLKTQNATVVFDGRIYSPMLESSIDEFILKKIRSDYEKPMAAFLQHVEGDFSLIVVQEEKLLVTRDPMGVRPFYYGENETIAAIASNRKTLWALGITTPKSFPPGYLGIVTKKGFKLKPIQTLTFAGPKSISIDVAAAKLQKLLDRAVQARVAGLKKVAVAFSGGLDSGLIASLAKKTDLDVLLLHVSMEGQSETEEARKAAEQLELPLQVHLFTEADLRRILPKVVELIEDPEPVKASVGVPFYWNAQKAAKAGYNVLLAGQGADELFGGYKRYIDEYISKGEEAVRKTMFHDVAVIHESNIERDEKICDYHDVELRLPFASFDLAEFAMSLPTDLKLEKRDDSLRKLVLRKTAENLGLPRDIVWKPKKALQYSTGVNNALRKLAHSRSLTVAEYVNQLFLEAREESK